MASSSPFSSSAAATAAVSPRVCTRTSPRARASSPAHGAAPPPPPPPSSSSSSSTMRHAYPPAPPPSQNMPFINSYAAHTPFHFGGGGHPGNYASYPSLTQPPPFFMSPVHPQANAPSFRFTNPTLGMGTTSARVGLKPLKVCNINAANQAEVCAEWKIIFFHDSENLVLRPFNSTGTIDPYAHIPRNFGTNALHAIVREVVSKCFHDVTMEKELSEAFVESVAKNNFEWYYVSKPFSSKLPSADYRPVDSTLQDLVDSGRVWFIQALSGKDNAVDTEIMRLLARERDKSRDLRGRCIFVIASGDRDYADTVRQCSNEGFPTMVLGDKSNMRTAYTTNFDFASDAWSTIMCSISAGCSRRLPSFLSPERPPVYPNKRPAAPQTPSASATPSAATPSRSSAHGPPVYSSYAAAAGNDSPRTRARALHESHNASLPSGSSSSSSGSSSSSSSGSGFIKQSPARSHQEWPVLPSPARLPARPVASNTPPIYSSPFLSNENAPQSRGTGSTSPSKTAFVSPAAAAAASLVVSLRRSPRLSSTGNSDQRPSAASVPVKTMGRVADARHSRISNLVDQNQRRSMMQAHHQRVRMEGSESYFAAEQTAASSSPPSDFVSKLHEFLISKGRCSPDKAFRLDAVINLINSQQLPAPHNYNSGVGTRKSVDFLRSCLGSTSWLKVITTTVSQPNRPAASISSVYAVNGNR